MSTNFKKHYPYFRVLADSNKNLRNAIIKNCDKKFILALCEFVDNVLHGNIKVSPKQKERLSKYKCMCRKLSNKKLCIEKKRKMLIQNGGFLQTIIPLVASLIPTAIEGISRLFRRNQDE